MGSSCRRAIMREGTFLKLTSLQSICLKSIFENHPAPFNWQQLTPPDWRPHS